MYSKNNVKMNAEKKAVKAPKYGLAKLSVGVASVLLGTTLVYGANAQADVLTAVTDPNQPTAQTSSAASDDKAVTSADVEAASQAATEAKSAADAHQAVVSDAQSALEKAKSANSKVAVVNDALNSARAAESAEAQANGAVTSANKALNEATEAYNTASSYNAQWENKYAKEWDQFKQKHAETVVALEKAQAAESAAQDDVNKMSADVTTQLGEVTKANAAKLAAAQNLENVSKAGYKNTSEEYKAALKLVDEAKQASRDADAKLAEMQADLEGLKQRLAAAKAETNKQEQKIAYQLGKTGLTPEHKAMMDAKLKGYDVIKAATAKKNVAQAAYNTALAAWRAAHAKTVEARAAYNQAKLDNDQPNATQLEQMREAAEKATSDYTTANNELNQIAQRVGVTDAQNKVNKSNQNIKNVEGNITKAEEAVKDAQSALDAAKNKVAEAQKAFDEAQKAFDAQPEELKKKGALSYVNAKRDEAANALQKAQKAEGLKENALNQAQNNLAMLNLKKARFQSELANNQTKLDELKTNADYKNQVAKVADLKAKADAANKKYNDADTFLKSTAELRMNLNRLQQAYEGALAQQAQLDKSAKDAQTAYEELYAILNNGEKPSDQGKTDDNTNPGKDDQGKGDDTTNPGKDDQGKGDDTTNPGKDDQGKADDTVTPGKDDQSKGDDQGAKTGDTKDNGSADANKGASDVTLKDANGKMVAQFKLAAPKAATQAAVKAATLPQNGNESAVAATGLGVAALVGMLGLAGASKRRA